MILNVHQSMLTSEQWDALNKFMDLLPYDPREPLKERAPRSVPDVSKKPWTVEEILQREG